MAKASATPQKLPQFGLRTATRTHEGETVSNRTSACYGESTPSSAHTAHHARKMCVAGCPAPAGQQGGGADRAVGDLSEVDTR